jgi:hypothetical protein
MGIDALAQQLDARLQDEVARHLLPGEVELVARGPHVRARSRERVLLRDRVVGGGPREPRGADVGVALELAERRLRPGVGGERRGQGRGGQESHRLQVHP